MPSLCPIRVLVADDHPIVRDGLVSVLSDEVDLEIVAQASNGQEVVDQFRMHRPDVAIVDLQMPKMNGVEAIALLREEFPQACFIMLTVYDGDENIYQGFRAGAKAYLLKETPSEELVEVIRAVYEGAQPIPPKIGEKLVARMEKPTISDRECQVLSLMAQGKTNREIASGLNVTESTVKFHVNNLLNKLEANDRTHAVVIALKRGIVKL
jgi:DNA-binding NarL/FixJ family response regulator